MSRNWIRHFKLTVEGSHKEIDLSSLRTTFEILQFAAETPNSAVVRITNPSRQTANLFTASRSEFEKITIEAGYRDNHGIIFKGNIVQARYGRENPTDTFLELLASDGDRSYNYATVSKTLAAGSTPRDHYDVALSAMGEHGVKQGFTGIDLSKPVYPRPVVLFGMARDVLRNIAHSKDATWSIQNGEVEFLGKEKTKPAGAIKINSETGMVGMPVQEITGINAKVLIDPRIKIGSTVHIDEASVQKARLQLDPGGTTITDSNILLPDVATDGLYSVLRVDAFGDTRGDVWYQQLGCYALSGGWLPDRLTFS